MFSEVQANHCSSDHEDSAVEAIRREAPGVGSEPTIFLVLPLHAPASLILAQQTTLKYSRCVFPKIRMILSVGKGVVEFWKNNRYWSLGFREDLTFQQQM